MILLEESLSKRTRVQWMPFEAAVTGAKIEAPDLDLVLAFDAGKMILEQTSLDITADFSGIASEVLGTIMGRLSINALSRFGSRRFYFIASDSRDIAFRDFVRVLPCSPDSLVKAAGGQLRHGKTLFVVENDEDDSGMNIRIEPWFDAQGVALTYDTRLNMKAHHLPAGQHEALVKQLQRNASKERKPTAGVMIDLDSFSHQPGNSGDVAEFLARSLSAQNAVLKILAGTQLDEDGKAI